MGGTDWCPCSKQAEVSAALFTTQWPESKVSWRDLEE